MTRYPSIRASFVVAGVVALLTSVSGAAGAAVPAGRKARLDHRWVFVGWRRMKDDKELETVAEIVRTAGEHGLNGMVINVRLGTPKDSPEYLERLMKLKGICDEVGVEMVPMLFTAGYGGDALANDLNLAPAQLVENALFVVKGGRAVLEPDPPVDSSGGGFEDYEGHLCRGFA